MGGGPLAQQLTGPVPPCLINLPPSLISVLPAALGRPEDEEPGWAEVPGLGTQAAASPGS